MIVGLVVGAIAILYYHTAPGSSSLEPDSDHSASLTVRNEFGQNVDVYWIGDSMLHMVVGSLTPGTEAELNTFIGHEFAFTFEGTKDRFNSPCVVSQRQNTCTLEQGTQRLVDIEGPCFDRQPGTTCTRYAAEGECEINPGWMIINCPKSCNSCDLLDAKKRCSREFLNITDQHVWKPGDLNTMFERILADHSEYSPVVHSRPPTGPWIITLDHFLSDEETDSLISWGTELGFERSTDTGVANEFGETTKLVSQSRTSSNAWCRGDCESDPIVTGITARTKNLVQIPVSNYESFQLLQYHPGQYYRSHHDMNPSEVSKPAGPRILTFFLYLSDVEEGGETEFPIVGIKVTPKKGRAVLWPSVLDDNVYKQDYRTNHAALPVIKGKKYAANHWIHSHDFSQANLWGCTGSFD